MRLIDADELKKKKKHSYKEFFENVVSVADIDNAPTIDAEPVRHGRWVMVKRGEQHNHYQCSECGQFLITSEDLIRKEKYCYTCGAKMEVASDA